MTVSLKRFLLPLLSIMGFLVLTACTSVPEGQESEIPWNTPQQWEGAPSIPGLNTY